MKSVFFGLILFCAIFLGVLSFSGDALAEPGWNWANGAELRKSEPTIASIHADCPTYQQEYVVDGMSERQQLCMFDGGIFRFATFFANGAPRAVIAYPFDSEFHIVEGACVGLVGCVYSPEEDTLAMRYFPASLYASAWVFRGVSQRIHPEYNLVTGEVRYIFDASDPDYVVNNAEGRALAVGVMAFSKNGKWLALELQNAGVAIIETKTGVTRRILAMGPQYGMGFDPKVELAISNDGSNIVVIGENAGITMVNVVPGCGDNLAAGLEARFRPPAYACRDISIDVSRVTNKFYFASAPSFDEAGGKLNFVVVQRTGGVMSASFAAVGYPHSPEVSYMALGDSFSSGEGDTDDAFYIPGSNDLYEKCHTSRRSYPFLLAEALMIPLTHVKSVACSGAEMVDVIGNNETYWGQTGRLGVAGRNADYGQKFRLQAEALASFYPGRIRQETFIQDAEPAMATIGVGGNDAGFMDKLKTCAMPGTCEWAANDTVLKQVGTEIAGLLDRLVNVYRRLKTDSPLTRFFAVGYPRAIKVGGACDPVTGFLLDEKEQKFMDEGVRALNIVIQRAASVAGFGYLNVENSLDGAELCSGAAELAMNGLRLGDDIALSALPMLKLIGAESFHPTPFGHELIAKAIFHDHPLLLSESCCAGVQNPQPSSYWPTGGEGERRLHQVDFAQPAHIEATDPAFTIEIEPGSFRPGSQVRVEVHSDPIDLGSAEVDDKGGLHANFKLVEAPAEGFHTIHILGEAFSGQPVDVYQIVSYGNIGATKGAVYEETQSTNLPNLDARAVLGISTTQTSVPIPKYADNGEVKPHHERVGWNAFWIIVSAGALGLLMSLLIWRRIKHSQDRGG